MLDIKFIRENRELVKQNIANRQMKVDIGQLLDLDKKRRNLIFETEKLRAEQNKTNEEISRTDSAGRKEKIKEMKKVKDRLVELEPQLSETEEKFNSLMSQVPNMIQPEVPIGQSEKDNVVIKEIGKRPKFTFAAKDYLEIARINDLIDIERAAKISGSRFGFLKNEAALIEFGLFKMAADLLIKEGFSFLIPPVMIKSEAMKAMGYIDSEEDKKEMYYFPGDDLYLVGTSEQSIGPMHMGEIFEEKHLPRRYFAFSSCFRREAGSYGKDTKGILRVHQFDKMEMFSFCHPRESVNEHRYFVSLEERLMRKLELPFRLMRLCSADFARPSSSTIDTETWFPGENRYRETHSTSNCTDFQSRRLNIRYRDSKTKKIEFVHMINGTVFSQRPILAILENHQQKDGSVSVPKALQKYAGFKKIEKK